MSQPDAKEKLKAQPWFGNIRELEHTIEKAVIIAERSVLDGNDFDFPRAKKAGDKRGDNLGRDGI